MSPHAGVHTTFLRQCVSAIDSLSLLADAMRAAKPGLLQLLKGAGLSKEVEAYYSRTVDAAADLRDAIYLGAAKQLLPVSCVVWVRVHLPACGLATVHLCRHSHGCCSHLDRQDWPHAGQLAHCMGYAEPAPF